MKISVILLAGGSGQRMGHPTPKQFLSLKNKPIIHYSLDCFAQMPQATEIVVVCSPQYRHLFSGYNVTYALPGKERQDSVYNGFQAVSPQTEWVCIHDGARPFVTLPLITSLLEAAQEVGAAALAVPTKQTIKQATPQGLVSQTLERSLLWEIQTPQILRKEVLEQGFSYARAHGLAVTDDVSLAELIGHPVKLVRGCYTNIKITTPDDLALSEWLTQKNTAYA